MRRSSVQKFVAILGIVILIPLRATTTTDTVSTTIEVSGYVPEHFSIRTTYVKPIDIEFGGTTESSDGTMINTIKFQYNVPVANILIASDTVTGQPETPTGRAISSIGQSISFKFVQGCKSVESNFQQPFSVTSTGVDVKSSYAADPPEAVEEECQIYAKWNGSRSSRPLAGRYSMAMKVTIISN